MEQPQATSSEYYISILDSTSTCSPSKTYIDQIVHPNVTTDEVLKTLAETKLEGQPDSTRLQAVERKKQKF